MTVQIARVEERFKCPGPQPNGLQAAPDGLWCIDQVDLKVYKFDYESGEVLFEAQTDTAALQRHYARRRLYVDRLDL